MKYDVILIDAMNLLHRAGHSYDLGYWEDGHYYPSGIVYGFFTLALSVRKKWGAPGCQMIICWDAGYQHRTAMFADYKKSRREKKVDETEKTENQETFFAQKKKLREVLKLCGWTEATAAGFEADDVLATLGKQYSGQGKNVCLYTMDGDLHQCVNERVHVISGMFGKDIVWGPEEVAGKWGFPANRIAEIKGLQGDSGDDIPGCPGCGLKWAQKLLTTYGSIDGAIEAAQEGILTGEWEGKTWKAKKLAEKVRDNAELIRVSHELAKVVFTAPIVWGRWKQDREELIKLFDRMAMHSFLEPSTLDAILEIGSDS